MGSSAFRHFYRRGRVAAVVSVLAVITQAADAQTVSGRVVDSAQTGLANATVTLQTGRTVVATRRTDATGVFELRAPRAGTYAVIARVLGYVPDTSSVTLAAGATVTRTIRLRRMAVALDTVVSSGKTTFTNVTPGRMKYTEHMKLNRGQFVSGLEIQASKVLTSEFLGNMPGFKFVTTVLPVFPAFDDVRSPPTIPGRNGFVLRSNGNGCLFARVNHWSLAALLDIYEVDHIDDLLDVRDIMGIELYDDLLDVPAEWKVSRFQDQVWHVAVDGRQFIVGDLGFPRVLRAIVRPDLSDRPPADPLMRMGNPIVVPAPYTAPPGVYADPRGTAINFIPHSFDLPRTNGTAPACGFVQIWTRVSW
jgi:hypothetical protein